MSSDEHIDLFMTTAAKVAAVPIRVQDTDEFRAAIGKIVSDCHAIYCPETTEWERLAASVIPVEKRETNYRIAELCIDEVHGAIAETGSLVCSSGDGKPLQAGLLASHHVAILRSETIWENFEEFFRSQHEPLPTNITIETGPSRTADIELTLTVGVHGPEHVTILIV